MLLAFQWRGLWDSLFNGNISIDHTIVPDTYWPAVIKAFQENVFYCRPVGNSKAPPGV